MVDSPYDRVSIWRHSRWQQLACQLSMCQLWERGAIALIGSIVALISLSPRSHAQVAVTAAPMLVAQSEEGSGFELEDFDFWAEQCLLMGEERQYEDALAACEEAIMLEPNDENVEIWATRSEALFHLGEYVEAVVSFNRVIQESPNYSLAIARQCASHFHLDRYQEAVDLCEQALRIDGNWGNDSPAFAWYYRGLALRQLGRLETALASFEQAITLEPEDPLAIAERCSTLADLGDYQALATCSITDGEELAALSDVAAPQDLGEGLRQAIASYEQALNMRPDDASLWIQQGIALEQLGDYERAISSYDRAIEINPEYALALARRCGVLNALGDYEAALESCEQALMGDERWGSLHSAYAWSQQSASLLGLEQYEDALAAAQRAVDSQPTYGLGWNNRAVSLWRLERYDEALTSINEAIAQYDATAEDILNTFERGYPEPLLLLYREQIIADYNRGRIFASLRQFDEAIAAYQSALDINMYVDRQGVELITPAILSDILVNQSVAYLFWSELLARTQDPPMRSAQALELGFMASQSAVNINPDSWTGWYNQGIIALRQRQFNRAFSAFEYAAYLQPEDISTLIGQGIALTGLAVQGQVEAEEAIALFELVLNLDPTATLAEHCRAYVMENFIIEVDASAYIPNQCTQFF